VGGIGGCGSVILETGDISKEKKFLKENNLNKIFE